jgi:hypothetical protein
MQVSKTNQVGALFVYAAVWFTLGWLWCDWCHKSKDDSGKDE